jgi:hypothetical protein
MKPSPA